MQSLRELELTWMPVLYRDVVQSRVFQRSLASIRRAHSPSHPCRRLDQHLVRPHSELWTRGLPLFVLLVAKEGLLDKEYLPEVLIQAWTSGYDLPEQIVGQGRWIALFREAGFSNDGIPATPPVTPPTLYRGSWHQFCRGLSWTSDWHHAIKYAGDGYSDLYVVHPKPEELLAHITTRGDDEWIVDPIRMTFELVEPNHACALP